MSPNGLPHDELFTGASNNDHPLAMLNAGPLPDGWPDAKLNAGLMAGVAGL